MKIFEHIKISCVLVLVYAAIGCNSWLDIKPENAQTVDEFWKKKEEVEGVLASAYTQMRECLPLFIQWGELRADAVQVGPAAISDQDMMDMQMANLRPDNNLVKWDLFYSVIGRCNSVIKYAPEVRKADPTFKEVLCNAYIAEAYWLRSYMYFYLVKNFKDVPFITQPYITDDQDFNVAKSPDTLVLNHITADLKAHLMQCPPAYVDEWATKGRATRWAYYALLADISMWVGNYDDVIKYSDFLFANKDYYLLDKEKWFEVYYPGNSPEGIFEVQWDTKKNNNNLYNWTFSGLTNNQTYEVSTPAMLKFNEDPAEEDIRGEGGSYHSTGKLWKFAGTKIDIEGKLTRPGNERYINWPIYRLSDIMLTKAMALTFKDASNYGEATAIVNKIRACRGYEIDLPVPADERTMVLMILDEREREFLGEGKRWFDLLCVAKQRDYSTYKDDLIDIMVQGISMKDRELLKLRLQDINGFYLPIHEDEIDNSEDVLVQNPYYPSVD